MRELAITIFSTNIDYMFSIRSCFVKNRDKILEVLESAQ